MTTLLKRLFPKLGKSTPDLILKRVKNNIRRNNFLVYDRHLSRTVYVLVNAQLELNSKDIESFGSLAPLEKYNQDYERMTRQLSWVQAEAHKDPNSRQLLVNNLNDYANVKQCFNLFQFVLDNDDRYKMIVYQRSQDTSKLIDDIRFFKRVYHLMNISMPYPINKIIINYGNIHDQK